MSRLSQQLQGVRPSATIAMSQKARELTQSGHDVISLAAGEPDFETPDHIKTAAKLAIDQGRTRYTAVDGITELKLAISAKFKIDNRLTYGLDQINVSPGGKAVLFNALLATLDPGDEVIVPAPCWVSYPEMVRLCGGTPVVAECSAKAEFKLTANALMAAITDKTKWLILNSPGNPTGACYSAGELKALGDMLIKYPNILVLTDDIYEKLIYDRQAFATIASVCPEIGDRVLTMNGVSKAYAMTGWRIGYAGGPAWLIAGMRKVMAQTTSNASSISQYAALAALTGPQDFLTQWRQTFQDRRDFVCDRLNDIPGLSCSRPGGAFYVFASCEDLIGKTSSKGRLITSDVDFTEIVLDEAHIAFVPGTAFHAPGHFRLSFAADLTSLGNAMDRLQRLCAACQN